MGKRRVAREHALKFLYQGEMNSGEFEDQWEQYMGQAQLQKETSNFMASLVRLVLQKREEIDQLLERCSENWTLQRMTVIDRNLLRLACGELLFRKEIPPKVAIDEAVEIAKKYGSEESPDFINGVLDRVKVEVEKLAAEPTAL